MFFHILLGNCLWLHGQNTAQFQSFTQEQGLSNDFVRCFLQDHLGFTWIGTENGLNRFDGYQFMTFQHDPEDAETLGGNFVAALFEDSQNRLWVGTKAGLARLDREKGKFVRVPLLSADRTTPVNEIRSIYEDAAQNIWCGTLNQGLLCLPKGHTNNTDSTRHFFHNPDDPHSIQPKDITKIWEDKQGFLWLEHKDAMSRMDKQRERFQFFPLPQELELDVPLQDLLPKLALEQIGPIELDKILCIGIYLRQRVPTPLLKKFIDYYRKKNGIAGPILPTLERVAKDHQNNIWIGSNFGLFKIDLNGEQLAHYPLAKSSLGAIAKQTIRDVYVDPQGRLWLAALGKGFYIKQTLEPPIRHFFYDPLDQNSISENHVRSIQEDASGNLWIGTFLQGVDQLVFDPEEGWRRINTLQHLAAQPQSLSNNRVVSIQVDDSGKLWLGTHFGMNSFDPTTNEWKLFIHNPADLNSISGNYPWVIHQDRQGILWIGDFYAGLNRFDPKTGEFKRYVSEPGNPNSISGNRIKAIHEDQDGILWIGTNTGLNRFDKETGRFDRFAHDPDDPSSLSHNLVWSVFVDHENTVWAGTNVGLNKLDRTTDRFEHFFEKQGLPSNTIYGLLEDGQNHLWASTDRGLARISLSQLNESNGEMALQVFKSQDGLGGNHFLPGVHAKSQDGKRLYFGGLHGFNSIHTDLIEIDTVLPNFRLSSFSRFNRKDAQGKAAIDPFIGDKEKLVLTHLDEVVSFQFSDLVYRNVNQYSYEYQLIGFSEIWTALGENRSITFTGLKPGNYTLKIRRRENGRPAATAEAQLLQIKVLPPWWKSTLAYLCYALAIAGITFLLYRFQLRRQLEIQENRQLKELDAFKNRLYTHITHEFRTPLTVIGGMLEQVQKSPQKYLDKGIKIIRRNNDNLLSLVNQILDLRKIEAGKLKLKLIQGDIIAYLRYIIESFDSLGESHGVKLHFLNQEKTLIMDYDKEKILRIMSNLLSNAIKFTPEGGDVYVTVDRQQLQSKEIPDLAPATSLLISIKDTGVGIPKEQLPLIFERFYQVDKESRLARTKKGEGSGIGLSLTKEFVKLMKGSIEVESEVGEGTIFRIILPVKNEAVMVEETVGDRQLIIDKVQEKDNEYKILDTDQPAIPQRADGKQGNQRPIADGQPTDSATSPVGPEEESAPASLHQGLAGERAGDQASETHHESTHHPIKPASLASKQSTLLIIEDNPEVVLYLETLLESDYQLSIAKDGQEGIDKAIAEIPDIIISDLMMPKKDGFEVCETLKKDERTSHIPIIILTAKTDDDAKIKGLERGADAYLAKPFNQKELAVRLKKLHELRLQLQARYSTLSPPSQQTSSPSQDDGDAHSPAPYPAQFEDAFILKVRKIIEKRMKSKKFGIPELCNALGMSRSQLHLKIKALTDRSTSHFIRGVRLQRAKELLQEGNTTVKEVAQQVGFPDPAYFSRTFTEEFGNSPREFLKE